MRNENDPGLPSLITDNGVSFFAAQCLLSSLDLTQHLCNNLSPLDLQTLMTILTIPDTHLGLLMFSLRQINNPLLSVYVFTSIKANI